MDTEAKKAFYERMQAAKARKRSGGEGASTQESAQAATSRSFGEVAEGERFATVTGAEYQKRNPIEAIHVHSGAVHNFSPADSVQ